MDSKKNYTLVIDASSKAIGWSLWEEKELVTYSKILPDDDALKNHNERVMSILKNFKKEMKWMLKLKNRKVTEDDNLDIILNTGYVSATGIDQGSDTFKKVEYGIKLFFLEMGVDITLDNWSLMQVLDSSWFKNISKKKMKRKEKKQATIDWALAYVKPFFVDGTETKEDLEFFYSMTDDEADAIACGYFFLNGMISDQTLISRKEKNRRARNEEVAKTIKKLKTKKDSAVNKYNKILKEELDLKERVRLGEDTKTIHNSISTREVKRSQLVKEARELEIEILAEEGKHEEA